MTYKIRKSDERKFLDHGWLKTFHTFSFGVYHDPEFMGFRSLRVINEDRVAAKHGFPSHGHKDMEIISIVLSGRLAHKDSMGTETIIHANDVQVMNAGTGIIHSEYNPSTSEEVHFLQIWVIPNTPKLTPKYQQMTMSTKGNEWHLIVSGKSKGDSLNIHQDVDLSVASLDKGKKISKELSENRYGWLQVIQGKVLFSNNTLTEGDGVSFSDEKVLEVEALEPSKILFFDLN